MVNISRNPLQCIVFPRTGVITSLSPVPTSAAVSPPSQALSHLRIRVTHSHTVYISRSLCVFIFVSSGSVCVLSTSFSSPLTFPICEGDDNMEKGEVVRRRNYLFDREPYLISSRLEPRIGKSKRFFNFLYNF